MRWKQVVLSKYYRETEDTGEIIKREEGWAIIPCAFCKGKGEGDYPGSKCIVCGGKGTVSVSEPIRRCVFCRGTGKTRAASSLVCTVCSGKGAVNVTEPVEICSSCRGSGKKRGSNLSCIACRGKGLVHKREMSYG